MDVSPSCILLLVSCLGNVNLLFKCGFLCCLVIKYSDISDELTISVIRVSELVEVGAEVMWLKV